MLAAEALRLAAIEALCPTDARQTGRWPTLARHRVFDSSGILPDQLDHDADFTPCLALYTDEVRVERRGEIAQSTIGGATAVLIVMVELSVAGTDEDGASVVPLVEDDARARLVLGALCAQVRRQLVYAEGGQIFRSVAGSVEDVRIEPFTLPQFDIRWMRNTMRFTCRIKDDKFTDDGGMPEPMKSLFERLPAQSYAKAKLAELNLAFAATERTALESILFSTKGDPAEAGPEGSAAL